MGVGVSEDVAACATHLDPECPVEVDIQPLGAVAALHDETLDHDRRIRPTGREGIVSFVHRRLRSVSVRVIVCDAPCGSPIGNRDLFAAWRAFPLVRCVTMIARASAQLRAANFQMRRILAELARSATDPDLARLPHQEDEHPG